MRLPGNGATPNVSALPYHFANHNNDAGSSVVGWFLFNGQQEKSEDAMTLKASLPYKFKLKNKETLDDGTFKSQLEESTTELPEDTLFRPNVWIQWGQLGTYSHLTSGFIDETNTFVYVDIKVYNEYAEISNETVFTFEYY